LTDHVEDAETETVWEGGVTCECDRNRTINLHGVPLNLALETVTKVFAKRGEIELTYDNKWICSWCLKAAGFWIAGRPPATQSPGAGEPT